MVDPADYPANGYGSLSPEVNSVSRSAAAVVAATGSHAYLGF